MRFLTTVFQDFKLFAFTIRENVDIESKRGETRIMEALEKSNILDKVKELPDGLDSHLYKGKGWGGVELSGGESQKLAIARAYLKDALLLILDEPTAAIDPVSEYHIYKNFNEMIQSKNAIYISHRMSSVKFSDKVLFLKDKKISGYDTHEQLMAGNGDYAEMYSAQAKYYV